MARNEKQFKMIRDQRYEEISNAALKVFARKGFAGTKISDITSSINLSHGLLYHYFKSKEDIYVSLIVNILDQFKQAVTEANNSKGTPYDKLNWFTTLTFSGSSEVALERHILIIEALQAEFLSEEIKQNIRQEYSDSLKVLSIIISDGQRDGIFIEGDAMELAAYYLSFSQGLTLWNAKGFYHINVSAETVMRPLLANP
ncbi:TetR/AcrR family transcriptional regulator [Bacillus sp. S3]|uniref:TetR/AcrR family transcriptional regulator n=1 Tax=Bacillus sp. S3 TaxID=486398 RepID=UPI00118CFF95|nr:TetR/AcrR family transcriptional regulator [Bacillus sp. S3]QCJ41150.1 TetR/AcrR family transcriptional regulator [Bacillus sp. S3]